MIHRARPSERIMVQSMGKTFRVLAIADNDAEANAYMAREPDAAVMACFGPFILLANKYITLRRRKVPYATIRSGGHGELLLALNR